MFPEIIKGIFVSLACILVVVAIGIGIGFACSGDYEGTVDPPEEADHIGEIEGPEHTLGQIARG